VLVKKELSVLARGVLEGRRTFANTLKYVYMATQRQLRQHVQHGRRLPGSALPAPAAQADPAHHLMTDLRRWPSPTDSVDRTMLDKPRRWDVRAIRRFMLAFGPLSSVFDLATFAVLILVLKASPQQFRTGWFLESVVSACLIVLVLRSRRSILASARAGGCSRPRWRSSPSPWQCPSPRWRRCSVSSPCPCSSTRS